MTGSKLPALRMDCGVDDFLLDENRALHTHLDALGILHEYQEHPGAHNWEYWNFHVLDTLKFFGGVLGFKFRPENPCLPAIFTCINLTC